MKKGGKGMFSTSYLMDSYFNIIWSVIFSIPSLIITILVIVGYWRMFEKAGYEGWKALIPFYNTYIMYEMAFGKGKGWMFLLLLIPCVNAVISIIMQFRMAAAFGKGAGYGLGLVFLPAIFVLILGFGDARYIGTY